MMMMMMGGLGVVVMVDHLLFDVFFLGCYLKLADEVIVVFHDGSFL